MHKKAPAATGRPNVFKLAKTINTKEAARYYLGEMDRFGKWLCPFHNEATPSFSHKNGKFRCFGCSWYGDIVDLVAGLYNIPLREAALVICRDFNLVIPVGKPDPKTRRKIQEAQKKKEIEKAFYRWRDAALKGVTEIYRNAAQAVYRGEHLNDPALAFLESKTLYYIDILTCENVNVQLELLKSGEIYGVELYGNR